jgi:Domain of unknown function (DUF4263)
MIEFEKKEDVLVLKYSSDDDNNGWLYEKLNGVERYKLKGAFHLNKGDLYGSSDETEPDPEDSVDFKIGHKDGEYFLLDKNILSINFNLFIHEDVGLNDRFFIAEKKVSIFSRINDLGADEIRIGGDSPDAMTEDDFKRLIKNFPNTHELKRYVEARISSVLRDFIDTKHDGEERYHKYMDKKLVGTAGEDLVEMFKDEEIYKYTVLKDKLTEMLDSEITYSEAQWQSGILQIILLLYPKYIRVFKEVPVKDIYSDKNRSLDFLLVDSSGNTDIIEIKKPFDKCIITTNQYRDNYIPLRELSGTVMQIEKYIFYLNKWGRAGEEFLTNKYKETLPDGFGIKITNPSGIIVMGRDSNLNQEQKQDFEVVRRKYKNVIDIITYDDLLSRLRFTIEQLEKHT